MAISSFIFQSLLLPFSILLAVKVMEMCICVVVTLRNRGFASAVIAAFGAPNYSELDETQLEQIRVQHGFPAREEWPVTKFLRTKLGPVGAIVSRIFRYRWLIPIQMLAVLFSFSRLLLIFDIGLLWATILIGILSLLVYRLTFGYADTTYQKTLNVPLTKQPSGAHIRQQRVQHFFAIFTAMIALLIVGYAVIYDGVDRLSGRNGAFQNIPHDWSRPFHLLYFSIVTFATVGYGDVVPNYDSLFARLATASEILAGFMLLGLLVTSVSLTFERD